MDKTLLRDEKGLIKTGQYTSVNPSYATPQAVQQARMFSSSNPIAISPNDLKETVSPYVLQPTQTSSVAPSIIQTAVTSSANQKQRSDDELARQQKINDREAEQNVARGELANIYSELGVQGQSRIQAQEDAGISQKQIDLDEINNQIESTSLAIRRQIEDLSNQGLTDVQKSQKAREIERQGAKEMADLSIIQNARNRNLLTAQTLVDQKIELETEDLKNRFNAIKFFYDENKEFLNEEDKRAFAKAEKEADREYTESYADKKLVENTKLQMLHSANEQGAPVAVLSAIQGAKTAGEAINAAGRYGGDILGQQLKQANINKVNKEAQLTQNTLPPALQTRVQTIAGQFDAEQAVKNYQTSAEAIDALNTAGTSPTDDIGRIYAFAKVMDPNSVVREGEYKTVQDYSTAVLERAGLKAKRVFENTGFLTEEARTFMKTTLDNRLASSKKAYDNIYSEYGRRIDKITGQSDGTDYITDYSRAFVPVGADSKTRVKSAYDNANPELQQSISQMIQDGLDWDTILQVIK